MGVLTVSKSLHAVDLLVAFLGSPGAFSGVCRVPRVVHSLASVVCAAVPASRGVVDLPSPRGAFGWFRGNWIRLPPVVRAQVETCCRGIRVPATRAAPCARSLGYAL